MSGACAWCQAPRHPGDNCPKCGANYAKADAIKAQGKAGAAAYAVGEPEKILVLPDAAIDESPAVEDPALEWKFCAAAPPAMLLLALLFHSSEMGHFLQRTFLSMPVHELGHAVASWFCGYAAVPTLWKTMTAETRGFVMPLLLAGAIGFGMYRAWLVERMAYVAAGGVLLALQIVGTLFVSHKTAQMLIVYGGDGLGMVLGVLLMSTFFFAKDTQLYKGGLRWGFLAIGAAAYVDIAGVWWAARRDYGAIPFGEQEGVGLSDATKLVDEHGWSPDQLVRRYMTLAAVCLIAYLVVYVWGLWQARKAAEEGGARVSSAA